MATYYKNAVSDYVLKLKGVRLNWVPTVLEDGVDNANVPEQIGVTNEVLEVEAESRDGPSCYDCKTIFTPNNASWGEIDMTWTFYKATTTASPSVLVMTAPLCVEVGHNAAWGELSMYRVRFRSTTWSLS